MKVGVILCSCIRREGIILEEVINTLQKYDSALQVISIQDLCTTFPEQVKRFAIWKLRTVVLSHCCQEKNSSSFTSLLGQMGLQPFSVELLALPLRKVGQFPQSQELTETFIRLTLAATLRAKARASLTPDHLKLTPLPGGQAISRRDLLFSLLHRHYEVIPAVDASSCIASTGCRLCLSSCPEGAILLQEERVMIKKESCTGCGLCLSNCPEEAILFPPFSPKELHAQLALLLGGGEKEAAKKVLLLACQQATPHLGEGSEEGIAPLAASPLQILNLRLPSLALLSPFLLLKALALGATGITLFRCTAQTCACHNPRFQDMLHFSEALLVALGVEGARLCSLDAGEGSEEALSRKLQIFLETLEQFSPPFPQGEPLREAILATSDLSSLLKVLLGSVSPRHERLVEKGVPLGLLALQGPSFCTFCGICPSVCPTRALMIEEEGEEYNLNFAHALCVACGECVRQCPEQVLNLERGIDFALLQKGPLSLTKDEIIYCRECKEEIAPARMLAKVQNKLSEKNSQQDLLALCATCRLKKSLNRLINV
jgi:ferredoxin